MTTLKKLHAIEEAKCIYNIHYCRAGVGFCFYDPEKDPNEITLEYNKLQNTPSDTDSEAAGGSPRP